MRNFHWRGLEDIHALREDRLSQFREHGAAQDEVNSLHFEQLLNALRGAHEMEQPDWPREFDQQITSLVGPASSRATEPNRESDLMANSLCSSLRWSPRMRTASDRFIELHSALFSEQ